MWVDILTLVPIASTCSLSRYTLTKHLAWEKKKSQLSLVRFVCARYVLASALLIRQIYQQASCISIQHFLLGGTVYNNGLNLLRSVRWGSGLGRQPVKEIPSLKTAGEGLGIYEFTPKMSILAFWTEGKWFFPPPSLVREKKLLYLNKSRKSKDISIALKRQWPTMETRSTPTTQIGPQQLTSLSIRNTALPLLQSCWTASLSLLPAEGLFRTPCIVQRHPQPLPFICRERKSQSSLCLHWR